MTSFPGLIVDYVHKHLSKLIQTTTGHIYKVRQNIRSTKKVTTEKIMVENKDKTGPSEEYLPPRKIANSDHIVHVTAVKFKDLNVGN